MVTCEECDRCKALRAVDYDISKLVAAKRSCGILKSARIFVISCCYKLGLIRFQSAKEINEGVVSV